MPPKLEHLDTDIRIPYDEEALKSGDPVRLAEYVLELVKTLQERMEEFVKVANYAVDLVDGEYVYFGLKGSNGEYPDGVWRRGRDGDDLVEQVKISGSWVEVQRRERPI